jgi:hypothetical protein
VVSVEGVEAKVSEIKKEYEESLKGEANTMKIYRAQGAIEALEKLPEALQELAEEEAGK